MFLIFWDWLSYYWQKRHKHVVIIDNDETGQLFDIDNDCHQTCHVGHGICNENCVMFSVVWWHGKTHAVCRNTHSGIPIRVGQYED